MKGSDSGQRRLGRRRELEDWSAPIQVCQLDSCECRKAMASGLCGEWVVPIWHVCAMLVGGGSSAE